MALGKHLHEIAQMPLADYEQWKLYAQIEPFGSHYDDLRAGQVVASVYNVHRDVKQHQQPFSPLEFTPWNDLQRKLSEPVVEVDDPLVRSDQIRALLGFRK